MQSPSTLQTLLTPPFAAPAAPCILAMNADGSSTTWTYTECNTAISELAAGLRAHGVRPGQHIVMLAPNRPEWVIACFAVLRVGGVVVPLDTQIGNEQLAHILNDSGADRIVTTTSYTSRLHKLGLDTPPQPILLDVPADDPRSWQALRQSDPAALPAVQPDDQAVLFYTSGTTGMPKGVPLTHRNLTYQIDAIFRSGLLTPADRILLPLPMYHVYPFTVGTLIPLAAHLPIVLPASITGPQLIRAIQVGKPTIIVGVPRLYRALYTAIESQFVGRGDAAAAYFTRSLATSRWLRERFNIAVGKQLFLPLHRRFGAQLRVLTSGGSALDPELARNLDALGWDLMHGYGLTETAPLLAFQLPGNHAPRFASVGPPVPGTQLKLGVATRDDGDDPDHNTASSHPGEGEILAHGPSVFRGYRNLPDQTAKAFTADGWFRTGDLGYFDEDGYLYISGRASTLIVTEGGKNIQPEPVEDVYQQHRFIAEIGILQHDNQLVALIKPDMDAVNTERNGDVQRALHEALAEQSAKVPTYQRVTDFAVSPNELPKTNLGKLRRHILIEQYVQAQRGELVATTDDAGAQPLEDMSEADRALLSNDAAYTVWQWLAERYPEHRLTPDTSPQLDLGVDSLAWLNLTLDISQHTGVELSEEAIKRINTVRDLLHEVAAASKRDDTAASAADLLADPMAALTPEQQQWLAPKGGMLGALEVPVYISLKKYLQARVSLQVYGADNIPTTRGVVLAPNHTSFLDAPVVAVALSYPQLRDTYWAGSTDVMFSTPLARLVSRLGQVLPVAGASTGTGLTSLAVAAAVLQRGHNLVWFPEGHISPDGELLPFRQGIGILLHQLQVPVVPIYIHEAYKALPRGETIPHAHRVSVTFGTPIAAATLEQAGTGSTPAERIANALHAASVELRQQAQARHSPPPTA